MKPILYEHAETTFDTNGIGALSDAVSCKVLQELNGQYELTMQYPVGGLHFSRIKMRSVILAKVDPVSQLQPFRVYRITKPSNGVVTVYARHIAYDLRGAVVAPFTARTAVAAMRGLSYNAVTECPFTFTTDVAVTDSFTVAMPSTSWAVLGTIPDTFGGEYEFDRWDVKLWNQRGTDRGVSIRYGKNLTSLEQDENCANCYTGVMPFWVDRDTGAVTNLYDNIVAAEGNFGYTKIYPLDLSNQFENPPTRSQLIDAAKEYMEQAKLCEPVVSWKVEFVALEQTEEYKGMALLERVLLGDTTEVVFEELDISVKARAVGYQYDSILERYDYVTMGSVRSNLTDTIVEQNKALAAKPNKSEMQSYIELFTNTILGAKGGCVRFLDIDGDSVPDTLYVADNADPTLAVKVWRINYEGWGASRNGYNGPFEIAATLEDGFLATFIKAGLLDADRIDVDNLFAKNINMAGTFEAESEAFLSPGWTEWQRAYDALTGKVDLPEEELPLYDFDGDGALTVSDVQTMYKAMIGEFDMASWSAAEKSAVSVTIDPSNAKKTVCMTGTNMWGRKAEVYFGWNSLFNGPDAEKNFNVILRGAEAYIELRDKVDELESKLAGE